MEEKRKAGEKAGQKEAESLADGGASELVDMNQAIKLLKTTRPTFYRWLRAGKIKGIKVGRQWRLYRSDIERFLKGEGPRLDLPADITPLLEELRDLAKENGAAGFPPTDNISIVQQAVRLMILIGVVMKASDMHIQGDVGRAAVLRYRVQSVLREVVRFDRRLLPAIVQELKQMASCDVLEKVKPQDGRIGIPLTRLDSSKSGSLIDLRLCFVPASMGEAVTVRISDRPAATFDLKQFPYSSEVKEKIRHALELPWGVIVVAGPTWGSSKIATLYACLRELSMPGKRVMTAEDPVESFIEGAVQVSVNPKAGLTFPLVLRSILRSDPDVIMIREVADLETLSLAQQAALAGHLVLTVIHTNEAASALKRMLGIGADPFLVADATRRVLAQRFTRRLCPDCSEKHEPPADQLEWAAETARKGGLDLDSLPRNFRRAAGCKKCAGTGYDKRTFIAEMLEVTSEIGRALEHDASVEEIRAIAVKQGMISMAADGVRRAAEGETALEEIMRIIGP